jgi:hypothetical protein
MPSIHPNGPGFRVHYALEGRKLRSPTLPSEAACRLWIADNLPSLQAAHLFALVELWRDEEPTPYRIDAARRLAVVIAKRGWGAPDRLTGADLKAWAREDPAWIQPSRYLRRVLRWAAVDHGVPIRPDALAWRPAQPKRTAKPALLTDAQVDAIRDCAGTYGPRAAAVIDYLLTYGARPITACRLTVGAIDFAAGELVLTDEKHSGGWRHALYDHHLAAWPALTQDWAVGPAPAIGPEDVAGLPIFPHYRHNRPWRIANGRASELILWYRNTIAKKLRLGAMGGIYHLKRWAITRMFRSRIDPATIAAFTGHLDLTQLMTYNVSNSENQRAALATLAVPSPVPKFLKQST